MSQVYEFIKKSLYFPPLVVLVAILIITIWPWQNARQNLEANYDQSIENRTQTLEKALSARFETYISTLQSGIGLLRSSQPQVSKEQWHTFFGATVSSPELSGMQGIGYSKVFTQNQYQSIKDFMLQQGEPEFEVQPALGTQEYASTIVYLYPDSASNKTAIGFNMLSETARRAAMEAARDTGKPTITEKVKLVQNTQEQNGYGFLMYLPYYGESISGDNLAKRRQSLQGYVYSGFRSEDLFKEIAEKPSKVQQYGLRIYDGDSNRQHLLYQTENYQTIEKSKSFTTVTKPVEMSGAIWQFEFLFDKSHLVSKSEQSAPMYILLVGVVTAFLVFLALLTIFKSRARELQAEKDKEINMAKDELLSLASHQMRTPATGVKQYLGMVLQGFVGEIDEAQKSLLEKAYTSNERQLHVINQILHLAKLESGRIVLAKHEADVVELVRDVIEEQQDEITAHDHTIILRVPKKPAIATIDSHMIRMAVENILSNAIKYTTKKGKIWVTVSSSSESIKVVIKDSGIGIDPAQFIEIFKQFTRLYDEQTERISGTGVGLYLADQLVKLHKGTLEVDSKEGKGSTFTICLPKKKKQNSKKHYS